MAVSFVGQASAAAASVTLPTTQTGDLIVIFAFRNTTTAPSLPAGYTSLATQSANGVSFRIGYAYATGSDTSGTWTNANVIEAAVYRGAAVGGVSSSTGVASTSDGVTGVGTMIKADSSSWAVSFSGSLQTTSMSTPTGGTLRGVNQAGTGCMAMTFDSNAGVASWGLHTSTLGASAAFGGGSVELLANPIISVGGPTTGGTITGANFTLTSPTGVTTGDVLIIAASERQQTEGITAISDGSGHSFTSLNFGAQSTTSSTSIWYRVVGATDGTTWTLTNSANAQATLLAFRGVDTTTPIDAQGTTNTTSSAAGTVNSVTTATAQAMLLGIIGENNTAAPITVQTSPSQPTLAIATNSGNGGGTTARQSVAVVMGTMASAGASGAFAYTLSLSNNWASYSLALRPTSAPSASIAQVAATVTATGGTQTVESTASSAITQVAATVTATGGTQVVSAGAPVNASIAQVAATITATGGTQVLATIQAVAIAAIAATVTATGGTQAVATVNNVTIAQLAATVTASGGTQSTSTVNDVAITQLAGTVTATGGTQAVTTVNIISITQVAATLTASGGTQAIATVNTVSLYQSSALYTDGVTGRGQGTIATASTVTSSSPVTLAIWFQLGADGTNSATSNALIAYRYWYIHVRNTTNQPQVRFDETAAHVTTGANLGLGNRSWHLVIGRYTPTGGSNWTMDLFQDGTKTTSSGTVLPTTLINSTGYDIGIRSGASATASFNRALIYNRAITDQEASDLWTANTIPSSPEGKYELNEGSGAVIVDSSGNAQTSGSLTKGYSWANGLGLLSSAKGTATGGVQTVAAVNNVSITQSAATITASGSTQTIATVNNVAITQLAGSITATGGTQVINAVRNAAVTQSAATITASGGTQVVASSQKVSITQTAGTVTATGGVQVIATSNYVSLVQFAANLVATGGVQVASIGLAPKYRLLRGARGYMNPRQVTQPRIGIGPRQVRSPRGVRIRGNTDSDKV